MHDDITDDDTQTDSPIEIQLTPVARLLLTPAEAAAALRISPRLLWSRTKAGEIPCVRIGKAVRYSPPALQAFIDQASSVEA
ncbi:MAG TPA: helix-turn-helix domain-containing protein [Gemmataceae bacterium]|nr:helix-turn-helix domain-containing protein [Gemmataceae bacterium]